MRSARMPGAFLFTQCLATGDPLFCSQIRRTSLGALTGSSVASGGYILQTAVNIGEADTRGHRRAGDLHSRSRRQRALALATLNGAYLRRRSRHRGRRWISYDCAGLFGTICQTVNPEWRHNLRLTWESPWNRTSRCSGVTSAARSSTQNDSDPDLQFAWGEFDEFNAELPDMNYLDLSAIWNIVPGSTLRAGITNVLDKDPPMSATEISGTGSANTYPTYDTLGRQIFVGFTRSSEL